MNRFLTIILVFLISFFSFSQEKKRLALVIGNSNYEFSQPLKNPVKDAKLIASKLDSLGFEVLQYEDIATKDEFDEIIYEFATKRNKQELGLIYYAGHAVQFNNKNYLLPTSGSVNMDRPSPFKEVIDVQVMINYLLKGTDAPTIIVLDACRTSPIADGSRGEGTTKGGLAEIEVPTGAVIAYSAKAGRKAFDGEGDNSLYALSFAKHMMTEDLNHNELFRRIRGEVETIGKENNQSQTPDYTEQLVGGAIYLNPTDINPIYKKIRFYDKDDDYDNYLSTIESFININSNNYKARLIKARLLYFLDKYDKSLIEFKSIEDFFNNDPIYYKYRSILYAYGLEDNKKALLDLNKVIELDPEISDGYLNRGEFYADYLEDYDKAIEDFTKGIELNSSDSDLYFQRARSYSSLNNYIKSIADYLTAEEIDPEFDVALYNNLAVAYKNLNDYEKALEVYGKAIKMDSTYSRAYRNRAKLYSNDLDDNESALLDYNKSIELDPEDYSYYYRGVFYADYLEDYEKAIADLSKAIELDPSDANYYYKRADYYVLNKMYEKSITDHFKSADLDSTYKAYVNYKVGEIYYLNLKDNLKAEKYLSKAIELEYVDTASALNLRGYNNMIQGDNKKALDDFNQAIELNPDYTNFQLAKLNYLVINKDLKAAIELCNKIIDMSKDDPHGYYILADIYNREEFKSKSVYKSLINISLAIEKHSKGNNYFITNYYNTERIELVDLYKFRIEIYQSLNDNLLSCEDYNKIQELIDENSKESNEIKLLITENCNN